MWFREWRARRQAGRWLAELVEYDERRRVEERLRRVVEGAGAEVVVLVVPDRLAA